MRIELLVPVAIAICVVAAIKVIESYRLRRRMIDSQAGPETVKALMDDERVERRLASLKWALVLAALSVAFGLISWMGLEASDPATIAVLFGATALGQLGFYLLGNGRDRK